MDIWTIGFLVLVGVFMYLGWKNGDSSGDGGDFDVSDSDGGSDGGGDGGD